MALKQLSLKNVGNQFFFNFKSQIGLTKANVVQAYICQVILLTRDEVQKGRMLVYCLRPLTYILRLLKMIFTFLAFSIIANQAQCRITRFRRATRLTELNCADETTRTVRPGNLWAVWAGLICARATAGCERTLARRN